MATHRLLSRLLVALILSIAILPTTLAAQDAEQGAQDSYERALLQAYGERLIDVAVDEECATSNAHDRAVLQAYGERLIDLACAEGCSGATADAIVSYARALLGAQDHVLAGSGYPGCGVTA
jgi:hypothetical protein